ncbi:Acg family FMN-binding oxidoreductase [Robiginitalea marina]|uniref:Nitroreductase family protein n=1 Tax=Robiginitalea marina TaxID=2954105 RepID=A0ABT1AUM5_9FLAO|nr:nitroreductase family protein [Robiginitalea marina]MCO5723277.1 nitroreductase family protein [Robiginitalea marina]
MKLEWNCQKLVAFGGMAPSGHNTQPWTFVCGENSLQIHPDFSRSLPIVDPDNHALYISLGCAAENIILAARGEGLRPELSLEKDSAGVVFIHIRLSEADPIRYDPLLEFVESRQVARNAYEDRAVPARDLKELVDASRMDGVEVRTLTSAEKIEAMEPLIIEGSNLQFENEDFVGELVSWIRFSKGEARKKQDGIWHASMGMPATGRCLGELIMKKFVSAKSEAKRWKGLLRASAGLAVFIAEKDDIAHWVKVGRAFQRFGLTATRLGIQHAHVNMPCEEPAVRKKLAAALGLDRGHPLLLVRFGYSEPMPYSFRRPAAEVLSE